MQRWLTRLGLITVSVLAVAALGACGEAGEKSEKAEKAEKTESGSAGGASSVDVARSEWSIKAATTKAKAGEVTFKITNKGATVHELAVVKSDLDSAKLPVSGAVADEKAAPVLGRSASIDAGKSEVKAFKLAAGKYVLLCNLPAHFGQGLHASFVVE